MAPGKPKHTLRTVTALAEGACWMGIGLWPLVSYRTFEAVTGRKKDDWLVKTIGGLIAVVGGTLLVGGVRRRVPRELALLGAASAATLAAADVYFVKKGRIARVYLLDTALQALFLGGWALGWRRRRPEKVRARAVQRFAAVSAAAV